MSADKITLAEFLKRAPAQLTAFEWATREHAETDSSFALERDECDWWREVSAYAAYVEFQEVVLRGGKP